MRIRRGSFIGTSNRRIVLVSSSDGQPTPKVIDFGIAKATGPSLTDSKVTRFGAVLGTLEYLSPEQAETGDADIDTRSDIYSLGVMIYELLTGRTPLDWGEARQAGYLDFLRRIREEEPAAPSTRLAKSPETLAEVAARRGTDPAKLPTLLRGELDWIVMKALEKDRTRRYETANGLSRDIERYLHGEPVEASLASTTYRVGKFAKKQPGPAGHGGRFPGAADFRQRSDHPGGDPGETSRAVRGERAQPCDGGGEGGTA